MGRGGGGTIGWGGYYREGTAVVGCVVSSSKEGGRGIGMGRSGSSISTGGCSSCSCRRSDEWVESGGRRS